jgi:hypothetical protein
MVIQPTDLELDKLADCWVLTHWLWNHGVALRLKIVQRHEDVEFDEPNVISAEIRFGRYGPFIHTFQISVAHILNGDGFERSVWSILPTVFAAEFQAMLSGVGCALEDHLVRIDRCPTIWTQGGGVSRSVSVAIGFRHRWEGGSALTVTLEPSVVGTLEGSQRRVMTRARSVPDG